MFSCEYWEIFQEHFFWRISVNSCFWLSRQGFLFYRVAIYGNVLTTFWQNLSEHDDDDDDDNDDDDELFLWYGWPMNGVQPCFLPGPLSEILTIAKLRHAASTVWNWLYKVGLHTFFDVFFILRLELVFCRQQQMTF